MRIGPVRSYLPPGPVGDRPGCFSSSRAWCTSGRIGSPGRPASRHTPPAAGGAAAAAATATWLVSFSLSRYSTQGSTSPCSRATSLYRSLSFPTSHRHASLPLSLSLSLSLSLLVFVYVSRPPPPSVTLPLEPCCGLRRRERERGREGVTWWKEVHVIINLRQINMCLNVHAWNTFISHWLDFSTGELNITCKN